MKAVFGALGFLIAPGAPFFVFLAFSGDWKFIAIGIAFAYIPAIVIGVPLHLLCLAEGWTRWWHYAIGGLCIGGVTALSVHLFMITLDLWAIPLWAGGAGITALLFWGIAVAIPNMLHNSDARQEQPRAG